jgi:hypothetical protein
VTIGGRLTAARVWIEAREAPAEVRVGENILCGYFTQAGGTVAVAGDVLARAGADFDALALVCVNAERSGAGRTVLRVGGRIQALGGGVLFGAPPNVDEVLRVSFEAARGAPQARAGYEETDASGGEPVIRVTGGVTPEGARILP